MAAFPWRLTLAVTALKLLLMPAYRSTDFEVHRNWLAITSGLPLDQWYTEATSEWTLDYPPLFAWFEWLLAQAARWWEPAMLQIHNLNYASPAAVLFQRGSVILTDLVLVTAVHWATRKMRQPARSTAMFLVLASPGLLIVDHIHFQYNGMLLGLLVWSLALVREGRDLAAACMFAVLVNMKHLFASLGPVYVVYLLRHYCRGPAALRKFATLALTVVGVTALSFGPFVVPGQLMVVLQRLFPFGRGLCHAYWAANFWALYSFADKALAALLPRRGFPLRAIRASMTGGLVGVAEFAVLPQVSPPATLCCVLASMLPCLLHLWRQPHPHNFLNAICTASLCSFVFGYHVHEKAILSVTVPLALGAVESRRQAGDYLLLSAAGHAALLPLLFTAQEYPIKILLVAVYTALAFMVLDGTTSNPKRDSEQHSTPAGQLAGEVMSDRPQHSMQATNEKAANATSPSGATGTRVTQSEAQPGLLAGAERLYLWGLVVLEAVCVIVHPLLLADRLPFLPLMLTSVYCAAGVMWAWLRLYHTAVAGTGAIVGANSCLKRKRGLEHQQT